MRRSHLTIDEGDAAPIVLLPGDPGRIPYLGARAGGEALILDNLRHVWGGPEFDPQTPFGHGEAGIDWLADHACERARVLKERDLADR